MGCDKSTAANPQQASTSLPVVSAEQKAPVPELPEDDNFHLGITFAGIIYALDMIGFPHYKHQISRNSVCLKGLEGYEQDADKNAYVRDEELGWVTEAYGDGYSPSLAMNCKLLESLFQPDAPEGSVDHEEGFFGSAGAPWGKPDGQKFYGTGYDICVAVRKWLESTGNEDFSICEVLLHMAEKGEGELTLELDEKERRVAVWKRGDQTLRLAGHAEVFYSHQQKYCIGATMYEMESSLAQLDVDIYEGVVPIIWWVDYFVLRQCRNDFEIGRVRAVIAAIGITVAEIDSDASYFERCFCLLETFATVDGKGKLLCNFSGMMGRNMVERQLKNRPIDAENATARRVKDKDMIHMFVKDAIGFEELNNLIRDSVIESGRALEQAFIDANDS